MGLAGVDRADSSDPVTSSTVPSSRMRPWCSTTMRELISRTNSRSCSTSRMPSRRSRMSQDGADGRALGLGEPGGRLVQQQHARFHRQHHGEFERLLGAMERCLAVVPIWSTRPVSLTTRRCCRKRLAGAADRGRSARAGDRSDSQRERVEDTRAWNLRPRPSAQGLRREPPDRHTGDRDPALKGSARRLDSG